MKKDEEELAQLLAFAGLDFLVSLVGEIEEIDVDKDYSLKEAGKLESRLLKLLNSEIKVLKRGKKNVIVQFRTRKTKQQLWQL